ncbi:hypothetical protein PENTCL1PPCAC_17347, partial [Pristionchus entomophagus]
YEKGGKSTILFFIGLELIHLSSTYADSFSLIYDYTSDIEFVVHFGVFCVVGCEAYRLINDADRKEMDILRRKGASIDSYSVARTYQLKENLNLMEMFTRILVPFLVFCFPEFFLYPAFTLIPKGIGYDGLRYFSIALYDLWLAVLCITTIGLVPLCTPKISKHMPSCLRYSLYPERNIQEERNANADTDIYFTLFQSHWQNV